MLAGTGKTRSESAMTYSCHVPVTPIVTTRCPTVKPSVPLPSLSITPTDSIPGTVGNSGVNPYRPRMVCRSLASTGAAATRIRTWPGPGSGIGRDCSCRTSDGSPTVPATTDRIVVIFLALLQSDPDPTRFMCIAAPAFGGEDQIGMADYSVPALLPPMEPDSQWSNRNVEMRRKPDDACSLGGVSIRPEVIRTRGVDA